MTERGSPACPIPLRHDTVQLAHGGGGRLSRELIESIFVPAFSNSILESRHDSAVFDLSGTLALTTDSYVVTPPIFPGGNIGSLAVCGTINDLAMAGAEPLYLSAAFVLEEGCPFDLLRTIVASMSETARQCSVQVVTGDTKVVDRGKGDGVFITTTGVGKVRPGFTLSPRQVRPGDVVLVSGDIGRHGIAVLSVREGLRFDGAPESDVASLADLVDRLTPEAGAIHCLRDLTRGGLSSALNEIALDGGVDITVREDAIPVGAVVRGACELLGLDPLYVACEGRLVGFVREDRADAVLSKLRTHALGRDAACIGRVGARPDHRPARVLLESSIGSHRVLDLLSGEQLPRIC